MNSIHTLLLVAVFSHSWLECTEYTGDLETFERANCLGLPRPLDANGRNVGQTFGQDIGMDFRPDAGGRCQGDATLGTAANYPQGMRSYETGRTYTLAWAPKNHVAATCTNANIPDNFLRLYMTPYDQTRGDPDQDTFKEMQVSASFSNDPHVRGQIDFKGFQNCPRFCDDTDKSLCTGTFTIGQDVTPGVYTFQWYWAFNSETDLYSTCWEANVVAGTGGGETPTAIETTTTAVATTLLTMPPGCLDCCDADVIVAPGTGDLVAHDYLEGGARRTLACPAGFSDSFDIMCRNQEVALVNGYCWPNAQFSVQEATSDQSGTVAWLSVALALVTLSFMAYVAITREWVTKETFDHLFNSDDAKTGSLVQKDVENFAPVRSERKRVDSVFTTSNTELPVMPEAPVWYYVDTNGSQIGPVKETDIVVYCRSLPKSALAEILIWDGEVVQDWTPVNTVAQIRQRL